MHRWITTAKFLITWRGQQRCVQGLFGNYIGHLFSHWHHSDKPNSAQQPMHCCQCWVCLHTRHQPRIVGYANQFVNSLCAALMWVWRRAVCVSVRWASGRPRWPSCSDGGGCSRNGVKATIIHLFKNRSQNSLCTQLVKTCHLNLRFKGFFKAQTASFRYWCIPTNWKRADLRGSNGHRIPNLSVQTQILVVGRHLENWRPNLCSLGHRGLVDGGGEKWDVVVDIWRKQERKRAAEGENW